ncbi:helix-turn-helix transcriptional regulator [Pontibacter sp. E15-1]|uniref:helix-turn-helix domain-containing protein n=1 Tax=Pontibacter sp. E15-1 TaxID=2919918 RepID=UPI001F500F4D|nr:helix-turn-helix transcriptional regulator [Pontibacter sp. E15-1]MCJ8163365.1 helix-turn-helix transcriptional regulator [Pontibacter sp. E15-1]
MAEEIIRINTISQLHEMLGYEKPKHPLVSIIDVSKLQITPEMIGLRLSANLYSVALKSGSCGMRYGRNYYDFEEGVLVFTGPNQVVTATENSAQDAGQGWMLFFHPDLIRTSALGEHIEEYTFFSYDAHEALHLSEQEKKTLTDLVANIRQEYDQRIDNHSQRVIVSGLELLLNYCARFYERQFNTRTTQNKDIVSQVDRLLKSYFAADLMAESGTPTIHYLAEKVHLSPNYLSDLLKKETGRSAKDHINDFLVDKAKYLLLNSNDTVSEIAYRLGFNYPHYFSRLFKTKTGHTPQSYREQK